MKAFDLIPFAVCTLKLLLPVSELSRRLGPPANGVYVRNPYFEKLPVERGGFSFIVPPPEINPTRDIISAPPALLKNEFY
jgi:hypothetical protein